MVEDQNNSESDNNLDNHVSPEEANLIKEIIDKGYRCKIRLVDDDLNFYIAPGSVRDWLRGKDDKVLSLFTSVLVGRTEDQVSRRENEEYAKGKTLDDLYKEVNEIVGVGLNKSYIDTFRENNGL